MEDIKSSIDDGRDQRQHVETSQSMPQLPRRRSHLLFAFICFLTLVEALDATSIAVALPVCCYNKHPTLAFEGLSLEIKVLQFAEHRFRARSLGHRNICPWHQLSPGKHDISTRIL